MHPIVATGWHARTSTARTSTARTSTLIGVGLISLFIGSAVTSRAGAQTPVGAAPGGTSTAPGGRPPLPSVTSTVQAKVQYAGGVTGLLDMVYETAPGFRPLKLDLYYAPGNRSAKPAVIWLHGGGWLGGNPRTGNPIFGEWDQVLARLAARGYVTAGVTYRLSGEARFPAAIQDVKTAVRWLRANAAQYGIDPARIAVWGESAGGHLAALLATSCGAAELEGSGGHADQSSCVQAAVDWYGPTDLAQIDAQSSLPAALRHDTPDSPESRFLGCQVSLCPPDALRRISPISYVSAATPPFLIMHGDADTLVPWKQSQELYDALRARGVSARLEIVPGVNHVFAGATTAQGQKILDAVFAFFDSTFKVQPKQP